MQLDSSRFPLIVVYWSAPETDEALETFMRAFDQLADRAANETLPFVLVSVGDADWVPKQRKRMADWMNAHPDFRQRHFLGSHVVVHGVMARGALTAIKWLTPRFQNIWVYPDERAALAAAQASLEAASVSVSPARGRA